MKAILRALTTIVVVLLVMVVVAWGFVYLGGFDVAAAAPHNALVERAFVAARTRAIKVHAKSVHSPALADSALAERGLEHYEKMCVVCHGGPDRFPTEIGRGLDPAPPDLGVGVNAWTDGELYWIVKNGIMLTGMPSFGASHSDEDLWAIVAFLRKLPGMSPETYHAMQEKVGHHPSEHGPERDGAGDEHASHREGSH
ncbi:MAG: cytochrome c [Planctomycetes bacterium]|nr:cytochrome c [Planctomycetota bacterium]